MRKGFWQNLLFDILLDISGVQGPSILCCADDLRHQLGVRDRLARFHDADDSCLRFIVAICRDSFVGLLVFFFAFFGLNLVDLDAIFGIGEI